MTMPGVGCVSALSEAPLERLSTRTLTCHSTTEGGLIWLYLGEACRQRGQIIGMVTAAPRCYALTRLAEIAGRDFPRACMVANAVLMDDRLLDLGYGIQLYEDLARAAAEHFDAPIVAAQTWHGQTSDDAKRVWRSRRFAESMLVCDLTAWPRALQLQLLGENHA